MAKILVLVPNYPDKVSVSYQFVHDRLKAYPKTYEIDVFCHDLKSRVYEYEGINVYQGNNNDFKNLISKNNYELIIAHFLDRWTVDTINHEFNKKKVIVWLHGTDSLSWKRRYQALNVDKKFWVNPKNIAKFILFILMYIRRLQRIKKLDKNCSNIRFVFVSKWQQEASFKDMKYKVKKSDVIHNFVNSSAFPLENKGGELRNKILFISSYKNMIYGTDIVTDIISKMSKQKDFNDYEFSIYGSGLLFAKHTDTIKCFKNVKIHNRFLKADELLTTFREHGVFLSPKRADTQGVIRCEAQSAGLVIVAKNAEAVSEFTPDGTGLISKSTKGIIEHLQTLNANPALFKNLSISGSRFIQEKCSFKNTIKREIKLIKEVLNEK